MARMNLTELPDDWPVYVPEVGEVTVGAIRETLADTDDATVRMWGWIATHPGEKPWRTGRTRAGKKGFPVFGSTNGRCQTRSTPSGGGGESG